MGPEPNVTPTWKIQNVIILFNQRQQGYENISLEALWGYRKNLTKMEEIQDTAALPSLKANFRSTT